MPLSDILTITFSPANNGVTRAGFGVGMILSHTATWTERTRTYTGIAGVAVDFPVTTPEYRAANAYFSQNPKPPRVMIGRAALQPTQRFSIGVNTVANSTLYRLWFTMANGSAWTQQAVEYTSDSSATNDEIVTGLKTALDALAAPVAQGVGAHQVTSSLTGSNGSKKLQILANSAGDFFGVEVEDMDKLSLTQNQADPGVATDLAAIALASSAWYGLITLYNSAALVEAAAAWVESNSKLYVPDFQDSDVATVADSGASDVAHALKASSYARTAPFFHKANDEHAGAAEMGRFFPINPGGDNWRMKPLAGVESKGYTETHATNIKAKRCNYYSDFGGIGVVLGTGLVSANEYIDVVRFRDWYQARLGERIANLEINSEKIPFDDDGIALIEAAVVAQNKEGVKAKGIAKSPAPVVVVPKAVDVDSEERAARHLPDVNSSWRLAGAINTLDVNVAVSV